MLVARVNVHVPRVLEPFRVLVIQVYRLPGRLVLGPVYRAYVLLVPKTVRDRLRPFMKVRPLKRRLQVDAILVG